MFATEEAAGYPSRLHSVWPGRGTQGGVLPGGLGNQPAPLALAPRLPLRSQHQHCEQGSTWRALLLYAPASHGEVTTSAWFNQFLTNPFIAVNKLTWIASSKYNYYFIFQVLIMKTLIVTYIPYTLQNLYMAYTQLALQVRHSNQTMWQQTTHNGNTKTILRTSGLVWDWVLISLKLLVELGFPPFMIWTSCILTEKIILNQKILIDLYCPSNIRIIYLNLSVFNKRLVWFLFTYDSVTSNGIFKTNPYERNFFNFKQYF